MFDIGFGELAALAVIGLFVFGPEKLPKVIADVTRTLREVRRMAQGAQRELTESLDPELKGIDLQSLDPRTFVRRTLFEDDVELESRTDRERLQNGPPTARRSIDVDPDRRAGRAAGATGAVPRMAGGTEDVGGHEEPASAEQVVRTPAPWDDDTT